VTLQNEEIFTVFFGPPSPKAMARQGHLTHTALQLISLRGCKLKGKIASACKLQGFEHLRLAD
jgi:hypothetical protein